MADGPRRGWTAALSFIPAAIIAGSGGNGAGFDEVLCGAIVVAASLAAMVVAWWTAPQRRARRAIRRQAR